MGRSDYLIWVMADNPRYLRVQIDDVPSDREIWEAQKEFVEKGYMVRDFTEEWGKRTMELYKADGVCDWVINPISGDGMTQEEEKDGARE